MLFPVAAPKKALQEADVAEELISQAYVYLLRTALAAQLLNPNANMPLVELLAADPPCELALDAVADPLVSVAKVYLFRVIDPTQGLLPSANMPTVPTAPPAALAPNPKPCADAAPCEKIVGIRYPHLYWV